MTNEIFDVYFLNNTRYLSSPAGLVALNNYMGYAQMRFYCFMDNPGRTVHLKTLDNSAATTLHNYMRQQTSSVTPACNNYFTYDDDTSVLKSLCSTWGGGHTGWGHASYTANSLYLHVLGVPATNAWAFGLNNLMRCDCGPDEEGNFKFGTWRVYVR